MFKTEKFSNASAFVRSAVSSLTPDERIVYQTASLMCDVSTALVEYRRKNSLSQKELAEKLDVGQSMVSKYESGTYNWTIRSLVEVSSRLGLKLTLSLEEEKALPQLETVNEVQSKPLI